MEIRENELARLVIGHAIEIHRALGPGLLEKVYTECLAYKLKREGFYVQKELAMPVEFEEVRLDCGFRIDILVEGKLLLELKSVKQLDNVHLAQTLTYLKLGGYKLGLLMNFNVPILKNGIKRVINGNLD